jgi:hypothetical protein
MIWRAALQHCAVTCDKGAVFSCSLAGTVILERLSDRMQFQPLRTLAKAKVRPIDGVLSFYPTLADALSRMPKRWQQTEQDFLHDSGL